MALGNQGQVVAGRRVVTPANLDPTHAFFRMPSSNLEIHPTLESHLALPSIDRNTSTGSSVGFRPFIFSRLPAAPDSGSSLQTPESRLPTWTWKLELLSLDFGKNCTPIRRHPCSLFLLP